MKKRNPFYCPSFECMINKKHIIFLPEYFVCVSKDNLSCGIFLQVMTSILFIHMIFNLKYDSDKHKIKDTMA